MPDLAHSAGNFIAQHAAWAGLILALLAFGESMVVIGAFLPGTALLLVAGGLSAAGVLDPFSVFLWAFAGAVAGDAFSYWLGGKVGGRLLHSPILASHRRTILRTRVVVRRHGLATMFIGRFAGPLRAFIPVIAGASRMPSQRFHLANVVSALLWVVVFLASGYIAARSAATASRLGPAVFDLAFGAVVLGVAAGLALLAWRARADLARGAESLTRAITPPAGAPLAPLSCAL